MYMPCQCGSTATAAGAADATFGECGCATDPEGACECGSGAPTPSDRERSLERIVMELDKRVRRLEGAR
jgi:hypothetical protein